MAGIDIIRFYIPRHYLDLKSLAQQTGIDPAKFYLGLGQEKMAVPAPDEDIVTQGANAAAACLKHVDRQAIDLLLFATESGIDQSKAAGVYVHELLGLPRHCQVLEVKQACCGSSIALELALDRVRSRPDSRVLVVASDIARYGPGTPGEPTQGAGAAAFVLSSEPRLLEIDPTMGSYTEDVMDFWRPNYRDAALVDGKFSIRMYLEALKGAWGDYRRKGGLDIDEFARFCYHQPFTKMAHKAHRKLLQIADADTAGAVGQVEAGVHYNRRIGNSYTASLYISLASMLEETSADLTGKRIGCYAYGSGCTALWFGGTVQPCYREILGSEAHRSLLSNRTELSYEQYREFYDFALPQDGSSVDLPQLARGLFRMSGVKDHIRSYGRTRARSSDAGQAELNGVA